MLAGHIAAALVIGRAERRINIGVFAAAALLLDLLLWLFVLLGWESVAIPADFAATHQAAFVFPWSHGLVAALGWSVVVGAIGYAACRDFGADRWRAAAVLAAAVFSHWLLDALVHGAEMPLAGAGSHSVGLGLWRDMPLALTLEAAIVIAGLGLFLAGSSWPRGKSMALVVLVGTVLAFTVAGMTLAPAPPSPAAMAGSSLVTLVLVCALLGWVGR
jgi:hypothetical protein